MQISNQMTDEAALAELGERLAAARLNANISQSALAERAGVHRETVGKIEAGASSQSRNLVRVLRALDMLTALGEAIPESGPTPLQQIELQDRKRKRAGHARNRETPPSATAWIWGDED